MTGVQTCALPISQCWGSGTVLGWLLAGVPIANDMAAYRSVFGGGRRPSCAQQTTALARGSLPGLHGTKPWRRGRCVPSVPARPARLAALRAAGSSSRGTTAKLARPAASRDDRTSPLLNQRTTAFHSRASRWASETWSGVILVASSSRCLTLSSCPREPARLNHMCA